MIMNWKLVTAGTALTGFALGTLVGFGTNDRAVEEIDLIGETERVLDDDARERANLERMIVSGSPASDDVQSPSPESPSPESPSPESPSPDSPSPDSPSPDSPDRSARSSSNTGTPRTTIDSPSPDSPEPAPRAPAPDSYDSPSSVSADSPDS